MAMENQIVAIRMRRLEGFSFFFLATNGSRSATRACTGICSRGHKQFHRRNFSNDKNKLMYLLIVDCGTEDGKRMEWCSIVVRWDLLGIVP